MLNSTSEDLTVGTGVVISGSVEVPGKLSLAGSMLGTLKAGSITIGTGGRFEGTLTARNLDLHGEAGDTLEVTERVILRATSSFTGTLRYRELEIERGARVQGKLICTLPPVRPPAEIKTAPLGRAHA